MHTTTAPAQLESTTASTTAGAAANTAATPLNAPLCPLCGQPNACQVASCGSFNTPCWCSEVQFSPALLAQVPADQVRKSCVCQACADRANSANAASPGEATA